MAFLGQLRIAADKKVYGWACDYCGINAESYGDGQPPDEWYTSSKYTIRISPLTYTCSSLYCSKRCHAKYNDLPWPPKDH